MHVYIHDVDYMEKEVPNFLAMRISSYHKQKGDGVTLLRKKDKLPRKPDLVYVLQQDESLKHPPVSLLMSARVYGIRYFTNWEPDAVILACRPDYLLYPRGRDKFERSDAVQLTDEHGHLLTVRQDDRNMETNKDTVVTDEHLWDCDNQVLCEALNMLKNRKNIYFLKPIKLSRILDDEEVTKAFLGLKIAQKVPLQWENSYPFVEEKVRKVMRFFDQYKILHPHNIIGDLHFYPKPHSTTDIENLRLELTVMQWMKTRCWQVKLDKLYTRLDSVYSHYYEIFHNWSLQPHLSFFELIAQTPAKRLNMSIEQYYCHPELWTDEMFRAGIEFYHIVVSNKWDTYDWALWQYQENWYPAANINWNALLVRELWY